jgi:hypothetical protein
VDYPVGRRVAALRALVDEGRTEFAKRLAMRGLSATNLKEIENGTRPLAEHERQRIAEACGVSPAFFTMDLAEVPDDSSLRGYVESLDNEVTVIKQIVFDLVVNLKRTGAAGVPPLPGETGRRLREAPPTTEDPSLPDSAPGSETGSGNGE